LTALGIADGTPAQRALARVVVALAIAPELPLPDDVERPLPEELARIYLQEEGRALLSAYAHQVRSRRLWVWYRMPPSDAGRVYLVGVSRSAPADRPGPEAAE
jgi:hypothetical protein